MVFTRTGMSHTYRLLLSFPVLILSACQERDAVDHAIKEVSLSADNSGESVLRRLQEEDESNAVLTISPDLKEQFKDHASGRVRGPLHGVPVLVKDNIPW